MRSKSLDQQLLTAVNAGDINEVRNLLEEGANPNNLTLLNDTPAIVLAASQGSADILEALLQYGADPNAREHERKWSFSALHIAARNHNTSIVKLLLKHGAYPNIQSKYNGLPLNSIAEHPTDRSSSEATAIEIAEILLEYGADLSEPGFLGKDLITKAKESGWNRFAKFLEEHTYTSAAFNKLQEFHLKYKPNHTRSITHISEFPNLTTEIGKNPLLSPAEITRNEIADLIIKHCINFEYESAYNLWISRVNRDVGYDIERIVNTKINKLPQKTRIKSAFNSIITLVEQDKQFDTSLFPTQEQVAAEQAAKREKELVICARALIYKNNNFVSSFLKTDPDLENTVLSIKSILDNTTEFNSHPNINGAKSDLLEISSSASNQTLDIDSFTSVAKLIAQDLIEGDLKRVYYRLSNNPNKDAIILCTEDILSHTNKYRNDAGAENAKFALNEISRFVSSGLPFDSGNFSSLSVERGR